MAHWLNDQHDRAGEYSQAGGSLVRDALGYCIVAVFLALCGYYVYSHRQDFAFLARVSILEASAAGIMVLFSYAVNVYQMSLFLGKFGVTPGAAELTALTNGMILGNLVIPMRGGTGGLAVYLKKVYSLDFQAFAVIYGGTALLTVLINTALALAALGILSVSHGFSNPALSIFVLCIFVGCVYLSLFPPPVRWRRGGILGTAFRAAHSWHMLTRDRPLVLRISASMLIVSLAVMMSFYFVYRSLGMPLPLSAVLITSSLGNIANLVPITPGSLGIFDAVTIQVPQLFGLDPARSIAGTLVFRLLTFMWAAILGIPGLIYIVRYGRRS